MQVEMTSNLFRASRMNGVLLPAAGEVVDFEDDKASAEALIATGHAKPVEDDKPEVVEDKPKRGRPAKDKTHDPVTTKDV